MNSNVILRQEIVHIKINLGKSASLNQISKEIVYINNIVQLCEKIALSDRSTSFLDDDQIRRALEGTNDVNYLYANVKASLERDTSYNMHALRIKVLAEQYGIGHYNLNTDEFARILASHEQKNVTQLLGVSNIEYNNPLEMAIEILPSIIEEAKWAAHASAALMLTGAFFTIFRRWQSQGKQIKLQEAQARKEEIEVEIKKVDIDNKRLEHELLQKKIMLQMTVLDSITKIVKESASFAHVNTHEIPEAKEILSRLSSTPNSALIKIPETTLLEAMETIVKLSNIEDVSLD